jgi:hypothetical protein
LLFTEGPNHLDVAADYGLTSIPNPLQRTRRTNLGDEILPVLSRQTVKGKGFLIIAGRRNTSVQPDLLIRRGG